MQYTLKVVGKLETDASNPTVIGNALTLLGSASGSVSFKAPAAAGSATYTLPAADGSSNQVLSTNGSATLSWNTPISGSGSSGAITYWGGANSLAASASVLFWDNANSRLGIGTNAPSSSLSVGSSNGFQVDNNGNILSINGVPYSWPISQAAAAGYVLGNDSAGNLTWVATGSTGLSGGGSAGQMTFWASTSVITGSANMLFDTGGVRLLVAGTFGAPDASGSNTTGTDVVVAGGQSTGTGTGGRVFVKTATAGSSGSSLNSLVTRMVFDQSANVYFGNAIASAGPTGTVINATGGSGTNVAGASLTVAGGRGTGAGTGGSVVFQTAPAGSTGTSPNSLLTRMTIDTAGIVGVGGGKFQVDQNGNPIKINNIAYSWPSSQAAAASYVLTNDGAGNLTWTSPVASTVSGSGAATEVAFWTSSSVLSGSTKYEWDNTNNRLLLNGAGANGGLLQATDASGTDVVGVNLSVAGGRSTGAASGGQIMFKTSSAGVSGTSLNAPVIRLSIDSVGNISTGDNNFNYDAVGLRLLLNGSSGGVLGAPDASGTDIAGTNLTVAGGQGTGAGTGGTITFSTAPAGSTGTSLNALVARMSIGPAGTITINTVPYQWPSVQASVGNSFLANDGAGNLTWKVVDPVSDPFMLALFG